MSFLYTVHRKLCHWHRFLCTIHKFFLPIFGKMSNFCLEPRTKILAHFKGSESEIAFLKFHFLLDIIMWEIWMITSRRKLNFKKAILNPWKELECWFCVPIENSTFCQKWAKLFCVWYTETCANGTVFCVVYMEISFVHTEYLVGILNQCPSNCNDLGPILKLFIWIKGCDNH